MSQRLNKKTSISEAIHTFVKPGSTVAVGGMHMHNNPMALVREVIRQKIRIGTLVTSPSGCMNADLPIGAGVVDEIMTCYVGFEHLGLAPCFRRAVETGSVRLREHDEGGILYGLRAGANGSRFAVHPPGLDVSDVPRVNPQDYQWVDDPFSGDRTLVSRPICPDVALIHCQWGEATGRAVFLGGVFADWEMILAARHVIISVDRMVSGNRRQPNYTLAVPAFKVDAIVEIPYGAHPTASHGHYQYDDPHLKSYLLTAKTPKGFEDYQRTHIEEVASQAAYIEKIGGLPYLKSLESRKPPPYK